MPTYIWSCPACQTANPPAGTSCTTCGCPAYATVRDMHAHRNTHVDIPGHSDQLYVSGERTIVTWLFIALLLLGSVFSLWGALGFFHDGETFDGLDFAWTVIDAGAGFTIAWLLYRLSQAVIRASWIYMAFMGMTALAPFLFDPDLQNIFVDVDWWVQVLALFFMLFILSVSWGIFMWYLYRLKKQGRLKKH